MEGVDDAHCSILKIRSFSALWWKIEIVQKYGFCTSNFHLCGHSFLKNCEGEFNETRHSNYIEGADDARFSIF